MAAPASTASRSLHRLLRELTHLKYNINHFYINHFGRYDLFSVLNS